MDPSDPEDAAALAAQKEAAAAQAQRLFSEFDADGSGSLDRNEVRLLLESQGVCVTPQYLAGLIDAFDTDGDGTFDRDEFAQLAQVVISRSVDAQNDVESMWYWLGLKYRFRDRGTGVESEPMSLDVVQMLIARGQITDETPFQCQNNSGEWENWGPLSEWKAFYEEGFLPALAQAAKRTTRAEDAGDLFDQYDADGSGALDRDEVVALLNGLGLATDDGYIDGMLDAYDTDGSGDVDRDEFQKLFEAILGRGGEEEGLPEGVGVESPLFWLGVKYRYMQRMDEDAEVIESAPLSFAEFASRLTDTGLDDATLVQISEPGGGWLPWRSFGEQKAANAGFRAALERDSGLAEGLPPSPTDSGTRSHTSRSRSPSPTPESDEDMVLHQLHVRGIGVDGWDGAEDSIGAYETEEALEQIFSAFGRVLFSNIRHRVVDGANTSWALVTMDDEAAVDRALAADEVLAGSHPLTINRFDPEQAAASKGAMVQVQEDAIREAKKFWHGLQYRFKVQWEEDDENNDDQTHVFGLIRQKVLHGEIDDATYVQIRSEGEWGEWTTLRECKELYDGFAEAVGKAVATDTLAEYKKAFNLFDKDGSGSIDSDELITVMKSLGVEATEEEVETMLETADADGSGEIDFNEFLALMTEKMGAEGEERLRNAKVAFWALQSYKYRAQDGSSSEWLCIGELQELVTSEQLGDSSEIFTERLDDFCPIRELVEANEDFGKALMYDYHQELMYVDEETQEESDPIPLAGVRKLVRDGILTDETNVWTAAFANWVTLSETRWQFGLAEVMMADMPIDSGDVGVEDGGAELAILPSKPRERAAGKQTQAKPREKREKVMDLTKTAAIKLSSVCAHAGFLCTTRLRSSTDSESKELVEDAVGSESNSDELREVFAEFDSDGSGQLDREEIAEAMQKALGSVGKTVTEAELDEMIKEMDDDNSGEIGFDEFAQWWKAQASSSSGDSKMVKYWATVVSVNTEGMATKATTSGRRAIVFYASKTALKPVGHVLSTGEEGLFQLSTPNLSMKLVMRYPHCFACTCEVEGQASTITLAARAAGDRTGWMELLRDRTPFPHRDQVDPLANASEIVQIFNQIDEDGSGVLDQEEMGKLFARMGKKLDSTQLSEVFTEIDTDGGGEVEIGEFERWWSSRVEPALTVLIRADVGFFSLEQILACVRRTDSPYNWMLARPPSAAGDHAGSSAQLYKAGSLGFAEACEWLDDDQVLYALVRVGFAAADNLRSKVLFMRCVGANVSAEIGGLETEEASMKELLGVTADDVVLSVQREDLASASALVGCVLPSLEQEHQDTAAMFTVEAVELAQAEQRQKMAKPKRRKNKTMPSSKPSPGPELEPNDDAVLEDQRNENPAQEDSGGDDDGSAEQDEEKENRGDEGGSSDEEGIIEKEDSGNEEDSAAEEDSENDEDSGDESSEYDSSDESDSDGDFDSDEDDEYERSRSLPVVGREATGVKIVVDEGYGATRFGICGEDAPTRLSNMLCDDNQMRYMIERQKLDSMAVDWEALETQWFQMFETELDVEGENCSVLATISPYGSKEYAETLAELLFETFDVNSIYFANPSLLSLYAQGKMTGMVVDSGECITSAFPVYQGTIDKHAVKSVPFGGRDVTEYVKRQMKMDMNDFAANELACRMKEELCYCGEPRAVTESMTYTLPDGGEIEIDDDSAFPYRAPEFFFFDPMRLDWEDTSLEQSVQGMVMDVVAACSIDTRKKLTENVLLAGGNTLFDGLPELMFRKVKAEGKARCGTLKMAAPQQRAISAWLGGSIVAAMDGYADQLITMDEYDEDGPESVHRHNVLADDNIM